MRKMKNGKIIGSAPILLVADVVAAANYYRDKLGFTFDQFWGDPPNFCMVRRDAHTVMLSQVDDPQKIVPHYKLVDKMWNIYFWVDDVEAIYQEFRAKGAIIDYELGVKEYNVKEFGIQDLDGYDLAFGQVLV
jgi:catechol 2,3-dioxygenase-like lactoylglutathione lyase family enzyme